MDDERFKKEIETVNLVLKKVFYVPKSEKLGFDEITGESEPRTTTEYEFVLFLKDGGYSVIDGNCHQIHRGDWRFIRPNQVVYSKRFSNIFVLHFTADNANENGSFLESIPNFLHIGKIDIFILLFNEMISANSNPTGENLLILRYKLYKFIYLIYESAIYSKKFKSTNKKTNDLINNSIQFMKNNLSSDLPLEIISNSVNLNPVYFNRLFKKTVGASPIKYLNNLRLIKAKQLLLTTNLKVVTISKQCGFNNSSYFIMKFKKEYSCTPNEMRNINSAELLKII